MNSAAKRSYRKNLITNGLIYIYGVERDVLVNNISMTGILVQLDDAANSLNDSLISSIIDFYLPHLSIAGTAQVIRVTKEETQTLLALEFKEITYNIDSLLYKRKVYRKNMSVTGRIFLNNEHYHFETINVSVEGLMIRLVETVMIAEGIITTFEFEDLSLTGEVKIMWVDFDAEGKTLVGLRYMNMNADAIKGIPRFAIENG